MKKEISMVGLILLVIFLFSNNYVAARGRQFKGILPPDRFRGVEEEVVIEPEEVVPQYPDIHLVVNIPARKVTLYDNDQEVLRHDVAVGQPVYKTPAGPQQIKTIIWNPWWIPPNSPWARGATKAPPGPRNPLGPVKMLMGQGIRLHGTNKDYSVGRAASHGCLRMHNEEASNLAWYIQKRLSNKTDEALYEKYKRYRRSSFWIKLDYPVRVDIVYEPVEFRNDTLFLYSDLYGWAHDIETEVINALLKGGINLKEIDLDRIKNLKLPRKRYEVITVGLTELLASTPMPNMSVAVRE